VGSLLKFFFLTYPVTWACFITVVMISQGPGPTAPAGALVRGFLLLLGTFAPALVALGITARAEGRQGVRALLRRIVDCRSVRDGICSPSAICQRSNSALRSCIES
jgi:hypothetical protein